MAIIVRGHERGALQSDDLRTALVGLLGLVGPGSRVFVRSWAHSDAPPGSTWRASSVEPRIRLSAQGPRHALSRAQLCSYFQVGLLGARLAGCELEDETAARRGGRFVPCPLFSSFTATPAGPTCGHVGVITKPTKAQAAGTAALARACGARRW